MGIPMMDVVKSLRHLTWTDFWSLVALALFVSALWLATDICCDTVAALQ